MRIQSLSIRNTKNLDFFSVNFGERSSKQREHDAPRINVLYAANGQGKTTVLEAISLIGHFPCMAKLSYDRARPGGSQEKFIEMSALCEELRDAQTLPPVVKPLVSDIRDSLPKIVELLATHEVRDLLQIRGKVWPLVTNGFHFVIAFPYQGVERKLDLLCVTSTSHSLSNVLSSSYSSDLDFQQYAVLLFDQKDQVYVRALLKSLLAGRSCNTAVTSAAQQHDWMDRRDDAPFVSYINTDLSDFGRGNDLRESPKSLSDQFVPQMVNRIGVPLAKDGQVRDFAELREAIRWAIYAPVQEVRHDRLVPNQFALHQLAVDGKALNLQIRRGGSVIAGSVSHLSAGENECLFIYLMLLSFKGRPGIILLDEPDLHIATLTKNRFYERLLDFIDPMIHQIVIATHSDSVLHVLAKRGWDRRDIVRLLYSYAERFESPLTDHRTVAEYDPHFFAALIRRRRRIPIGRIVRLLMTLRVDRIRDIATVNRSAALSTLSTLITVATGLAAISVMAIAFFLRYPA